MNSIDLMQRSTGIPFPCKIGKEKVNFPPFSFPFVLFPFPFWLWHFPFPFPFSCLPLVFHFSLSLFPLAFGISLFLFPFPVCLWYFTFPFPFSLWHLVFPCFCCVLSGGKMTQFLVIFLHFRAFYQFFVCFLYGFEAVLDISFHFFLPF